MVVSGRFAVADAVVTVVVKEEEALMKVVKLILLVLAAELAFKINLSRTLNETSVKYIKCWLLVFITGFLAA